MAKKTNKPAPMFVAEGLEKYTGSDPKGGGPLPKDGVFHFSGKDAEVSAAQGGNNGVIVLKDKIATKLKGFTGASVGGRIAYTGVVKGGPNKGQPNNVRIGDIFRSAGWSEEKIQAIAKKKKMSGDDLAKLIKQAIAKNGFYATTRTTVADDGKVYSNLGSFVSKEYYTERLERDDGKGSAITWPHAPEVRRALSGESEEEEEAEDEGGEVEEESEEEEDSEESEEESEDDSEEEESEGDSDDESDDESEEEEEEEEEEEPEADDESESDSEGDSDEDEDEDEDARLQKALGKAKSKAPAKKAPTKKAPVKKKGKE